MKRRLLELEVLCCPVCGGGLAEETFQGASGEIEEGRLMCRGCARVFPIIAGIPRLLPDELAHMSLRFHPEFFRRYAAPMAPWRERCRPGVDGSRWWRAERRTMASYSYQWRKFSDMFPHWEQVFRDSVQPITPDFFRGRLGLDAGCGFGRSLYYAASYGAEMIGLDLSEAVEAARGNVGHLPNVHLVQADIFHPPFADQSLDFVYSIGVLHHLPDPEAGFSSLAKRLKPGAPIFIWVYARGRGRQIPFLTLMRAVSTRVPFQLLDALCWLLAAGQWVLWILPYRLLNRIPLRLTRALARRLPFTLYARYPFRVLRTDWFDGLSVPLQRYYRREEIAGWFKREGLQRITIAPAWAGRALGYRPVEAEVGG